MIFLAEAAPELAQLRRRALIALYEALSRRGRYWATKWLRDGSTRHEYAEEPPDISIELREFRAAVRGSTVADLDAVLAMITILNEAARAARAA